MKSEVEEKLLPCSTDTGSTPLSVRHRAVRLHKCALMHVTLTMSVHVSWVRDETSEQITDEVLRIMCDDAVGSLSRRALVIAPCATSPDFSTLQGSIVQPQSRASIRTSCASSSSRAIRTDDFIFDLSGQGTSHVLHPSTANE